MQKGIAIVLVLVFSLVFVLGACAGGAVSADTESFYKNNAVTCIVNGSAGGATDFAIQIVAKYWTQVTGGPTPQVVIKSGGGGLEGVNFTYDAKPDGLTICVDHYPSTFTSPAITGLGGPKFDPRELGWIGIFGFTPNAFMQRVDTQYKTIDDLKKAKGLKFGYTTAGGINHVAGALAIDAFKFDAKLVGGYEATELGLAAKRGELEGYSGATVAVQDIQNGFVKPIWIDDFKETLWYPGVPPIASLVKMTPEQESILKLVVALKGCKGFFTTPKVPADRLTYLRRTFDKIVAIPAFLQDSKAKFTVWDKPMTGEQAAEDLKQVYNTPPEIKQAFSDFIKKYTK